MAATSCSADCLAKRSSSTSWSAVSSYRSATLLDEPGVQQLAHPLVAQAADVHRVARGEVDDALQDPPRAGRVGAVAHRLVRRALHRRAAGGASSGIRHGAERVLGSTPSSSGRTTWGITSPARMTSTRSPSRMSFWAISSSLCSVALLTVTPADLDRLQRGPRIERAGAAHVDLDVAQPGHRHLGRELPGDRPARLPAADDAQLGVEPKPVHLDDHAVGLERERGEQLLEALRSSACTSASVSKRSRWGSTWKPQASSRSSTSEWVLRGQRALDRLDREGEHPEPPLAGERRVELAEAAGRGVARVGEERLALLLPLLVDPGEAGVGQVHLAPHFHDAGPSPPLSASGTSAMVRRLAVMSSPIDAVAAGGADGQPARPRRSGSPRRRRS